MCRLSICTIAINCLNFLYLCFASTSLSLQIPVGRRLVKERYFGALRKLALLQKRRKNVQRELHEDYTRTIRGQYEDCDDVNDNVLRMVGSPYDML